MNTISFEDYAQVILADGSIYKAKEVIIATGAFYIDSNLKGILTPSLSYLVSIPFNMDN